MNDWTDSKPELIKYLKEIGVHPLPHLTHDDLLSVYHELWKSDPRKVILDRKLRAMKRIRS